MSAGPVYTIDDPLPIAAEAPYTFFLPSAEELAALAPGDHAKLIFRPKGAARKGGAERMWVKIATVDGDRLEGSLDNVPADIPGLALGDRVSFPRQYAIACAWADERDAAPPAPSGHREYWERCLVDRCVVEDGVPIQYVYREVPDMTEEGDRYPDSGWRIRGDYRGLSDAQVDARDAEYTALGRVLNADDSWLHLIDAPIGSAFIRDWEANAFVPMARDG